MARASTHAIGVRAAGRNSSDPGIRPLPLVILAERLTRTVAVARALTLAGRTINLSGFQDGVGILCAKTLDLPDNEAQSMLPALLEVMAQIEALTVSVSFANEARGDAASFR